MPSSAVPRGVNGLYVYLAQPGGPAGLQAVEEGQDDGGIAIITKGLSGNETVVTAGQSRLTDGTRIATNAQANATPPGDAGTPPKSGG